MGASSAHGATVSMISFDDSWTRGCAKLGLALEASRAPDDFARTLTLVARLREPQRHRTEARACGRKYRVANRRRDTNDRSLPCPGGFHILAVNQCDLDFWRVAKTWHPVVREM